MTNDYSEKMDHISSIFDQGTAKSKTFTETNTNHNGFHIASTISQDHTEQEIYSLINMETTVAEDKDIIKTQLKKIVNQMTKTTDLMAPMKARDMEITQLGEGGKTRDKNTPGTRGKWKEGKHFYDKGGYFYTHGYLFTITYTRKTFGGDKRKPYHNEEAARSNHMSGSQVRKPHKRQEREEAE